MLIVRNLETRPVKTEITVHQPLPLVMTEEFSGEKLLTDFRKDVWVFKISLDAEEVKVYCDSNLS
jgi:hypothetical protein